MLSERERTYALACAAVVPFTAGLAFFVWAVREYHVHPPQDYTVPFGPVGDGWVYAMLFAIGTLCTLGGPILGLVVGRWLHFRGAAILTSVALILLTIVFQGLVEPLRTVRVFWPWTYFGGPFGDEGDPERWLIFTGSPQWYCLYLVALCALGVVVAALHDRESPRAGLARLAGVLAVVAVVLGTISMVSGPEEQGTRCPARAPRSSPVVRHAARALPWPLLAAAAVLLYGLLRAVQEWPYAVWPVEGLAVGFLAGMAAFAYDEPAAAVVDTLPRGLAWRTAARSLGVALLLGWWLLVVALTRDTYLRPRHGDRLAGSRGTVAVVATTAHLRSRGAAGPATLVGTAVVGGAMFLALAQPLQNRLPIFPLPAAEPLVRQPHAVDRPPRGHHGLAGRDVATLGVAEHGRVVAAVRAHDPPRSRRTPGPRPPARPRRGRAGRRCRP